MKRLRSNDDLDPYAEKGANNDWGRREDDSPLPRSSSSQRSSYYKPSETGRKVTNNSSTPRYDRLEDDRDGSRIVRKRSDHDLESYDRRKGYDRHREVNERGIVNSSPRAAGYGTDRNMFRSESFSGPRRDFPKGFRSERDRSRRENSVTSWRRFGVGKDGDDVKSPHGVRDTKSKSPALSKDSSSEQSKSVEVKKFEDTPVESGEPSSEREEGELEPDPNPPAPPEVLANPAGEENLAVDSNLNQDKINRKYRVDHEVSPNVTVEKPDSSKVEQAERELSKDAQDNVSKTEESSHCQDTPFHGTGGIEDEKETMGENELSCNGTAKDLDDTFVEKPLSSQEQRRDEGTDLKTNADDNFKNGDVGFAERSEMPLIEEEARNLKDKGKGILVSPSNSLHFAEFNSEVGNKTRDLEPSVEIEREGGSSTMGFQFFSTDPIKKQERVEPSSHNKPRDDKLALELSLSLPNVLLPIGSQNIGQWAPSSPTRTKSFQSFSSFRTNSDGFTASMSFSGSQQFTHNPSCSLTHNALDYEKSVGSKPLFQGVDWNALASDENKNNESSKLPVQLEKQLSFNKNISGSIHNNFQKINEPNGEDQMLLSEADFAESIVTKIVSEPIHTMARKFSSMTEQNISRVKNFVREIFSNPVKQWQLTTLQKALRKRTDITLDTLPNAHPTQLQILVALKTGLQNFLSENPKIPSNDLAEIFLATRCRNINCLLPVDECDCKICAKRKGFCHDCMCLVCSKFDTASDTCSWVGCDVCMHWCHADCGLRESHVRNGLGPRGNMEMQFHCVACDHPSEMFGFVREVFQNFVKEWNVENLCRELECVGRIFSGSEDVRGRRMHEMGVRMLAKLANGADLGEVRNHILSFFTDNDLLNPENVSTEPNKELPTKIQERSNGIAGPSQGPDWRKPVYPDKATNSLTLLPDFHHTDSRNNNNKYQSNFDSLPIVRKEPVFDELDSIVRIKQAEAKMFQTRADDARREAEALKRISVSKNEMIEEEYSTRVAKLRLAEAEEMRKQKVEELRVLDRGYQEYFVMKMRMESDIKDLLLKMEATRRNLPM